TALRIGIEGAACFPNSAHCGAIFAIDRDPSASSMRNCVFTFSHARMPCSAPASLQRRQTVVHALNLALLKTTRLASVSRVVSPGSRIFYAICGMEVGRSREILDSRR